MLFTSMVVDDLYVFGTAVSPPEADTVLVVDADAVLSAAISFQGLEPVARRDAQIVKDSG